LNIDLDLKANRALNEESLFPEWTAIVTFAEVP